MKVPARVLMLAARLVLGGFFVYYGWYKIAHPDAFLQALRGYEVLPVSPPELMNVTAVTLPWVEVICGALLLTGAWLRPAAALTLGLTVVFTVAVTGRAFAESAASSLSLCSVQFECGCGPRPVFFCAKLAENVLLISLAVFVTFSRRLQSSTRA